MPGKLTRKEIQQDQIRSVLEDIYAWLTLNATYLAVGVAAVAAIVVGAWGWRSYQEGVAMERQARLAEALEIFHAPIEGQEATPEPGHEGHDHGPEQSSYHFANAQERNLRALEEFADLAESDPDSRTGLLSRYYEAVALRALERDEEAAAKLESLIADLDEPELSNLARNQLALILLSQGNFDAAIENWTAILEGSAPNFPRDQILAMLGRACERAGKEAEALEYYRRLVAEFPAAPTTRDVERRIDYLEAYLPAEPTESTTQPASDEVSG